jgi:tryptophan synthase alpha chain
VTGARRALGADVAEFVARVRRHTSLPIAVGFGVSAPEHVAALRGVADAVIVGSAALDAVSAAPADRRPEALRVFVSTLAAAGRA